MMGMNNVEDETGLQIPIPIPLARAVAHHHRRSNSTGSQGAGGSDYDEISKLISNLDHEIPDIRIRALKHLERKLDLGFVFGHSLSQRQDLLLGITSWLRSLKWTEDELRLILLFLQRMLKREEFRKNFMKTPLDSILTKARKVVKSDTRILIDRILDSVQSFDIYCEGPAESWNDNLSGQPRSTSTPRFLSKSCTELPVDSVSSGHRKSPMPQIHHSLQLDQGAMGDMGFFGNRRIDKSKSQSEDSPEQQQNQNRIEQQKAVDLSAPSDSEVYYFESSRSRRDREQYDWTRTISIGIPNFKLESSDRRVLASTIESLLSQNEKLIFITSSFYRDVLLNDFPSEVFVQESSLCMGLLQVIEESSSHEDKKISYTIFQTLMKLSHSLQLKLNYYLSSEFHQCQKETTITDNDEDTFRSQSADPYSTGRYQRYSPARKITKKLTASTENFITNLSQLCKGLSRAITFKTDNIYLWVLLESFTNLLKKFMDSFLTDSTPFYLNLEEILLDIAQTYIRHPDNVSPEIVAIILSSLVQCFGQQKSASFALSKDIRRAIWSLGANTKLPKFIKEHFVETVKHFEPELDRANASGETNRPLEPIDYDSWWKYDAVQQQNSSRTARSVDGESTENPEEIIANLLHSIQNAVEHEQVIETCKELWNPLLSLVLNTRGVNPVDKLVIPDKCEPEWRESFCRFLSVDTNSPEDEEVVVVILDVLTFLFKNLKDSRSLKLWIIPITTEKGSAMLRILGQCYENNRNTGTTLTSLTRSIFDFYVALTADKQDDHAFGDLFDVLIQLLMNAAEDTFKSPALLHPILQLIAHLTSCPNAKDKLKNEALSLTILKAVTTSIRYLGERSTDGTFRNQGSIYYGAVITSNLTHILAKTETNDSSTEWIEYCSQIVPALWVIENSIIRAASLQICANVTSMAKGVYVLVSELESPTLLWKFAYRRFTDPEEIPLVREKSGVVLFNLIKQWNEIRNVTKTELAIPKDDIVRDVQGLLYHIYWFPSISMEPTDEINSNVTSTGASFVTPNVLSITSQLIISIMGSDVETGAKDLVILFARTIGHHQICETMDENWWMCSCRALINALQALVTIIDFQKLLSVFVISDRINLVNILRLLQLTGPNHSKNPKQIKSLLNILRKKVFTLLIQLCTNAGNNYEDLERLLWSQRNILFTKIVEWLNIHSFVENRRLVLSFLSVHFYSTNTKIKSPSAKAKLCQDWVRGNGTGTTLSYGSTICQELINLLEHYIEDEDLISVLYNLNNLVQISPSAKEFSIRLGIVEKLLKRLSDLGVKSLNENYSSSTSNGINFPINRKLSKYSEQTKWILLLLTNLFTDQDSSSKTLALKQNFAEIIHVIFKSIITTSAERNLLYILIELLITYTYEFPQGSQSLTTTTGSPGVHLTMNSTIRKISNPSSLFNELLLICQLELEAIDRNPNLKTIELIFNLIKNTSFNIECRNVLLKSKILQFLSKFHLTEVRKWGLKFPTIKSSYLNLVFQLTAYPDVQLYYGKLPESIEILILLLEYEPKPISLQALQILRNIGFHIGNRPRLLHEHRYLSTLITKLHESIPDSDLSEISASSVALWALTANNEKGKVAAKRINGIPIILGVIEKLKKMIHTISTSTTTLVSFPSSRPESNVLEKEEIEAVISLLENNLKVLNSD